MLEVTSAIRIPDSELTFTFARSGGPGGQNVNKVSSKAILRWDFQASSSVPDAVKVRFRERFGSRLTKEGHLVLHSQKCRDQAGNIEDCRNRLREMLQSVATAPVQRRNTRRTRGSVERRLQDKKARSQRKQQRRRPGSSDYQ